MCAMPHDASRLGAVDDTSMADGRHRLQSAADWLCRSTRQMDQPAVPMDERLTEYLAESIEAAGFPAETDAERRGP